MKIGEEGIFQAAFVGSLLPRILSIIDDKGIIRLPGNNYSEFTGWIISVFFIAVAAGWVAAKIWKERDARQAFFLGLGFLYLVTGAAQDATKVRNVLAPAPASAQYLAQRVTGPNQVGLVVINAKVNAPPDPKRTVEVVLQDASTGVTRLQVQTASFPYTLSVQPGRYLLKASAPDLIGSTKFAVPAGQKAAVTVELHRKSRFRTFWEGVKRGVITR